MHILENENVKVELSKDAAVLRLTDKKNGVLMESNSPFQFIYGGFYTFDIPRHARAMIETEADSIVVHFDSFAYWSRFREHYYVKPENGPDVRFKFRIILEKDTVRFQTEPIENMDEENCIVIFPASLIQWRTDAVSELVLPKGYGSVFRFPYHGACAFNWSSMLLPVYGVFSEKGGFGVYVRDNYDQQGYLNVNLRRKNIAISEQHWEFDRTGCNYQRELSLKFFGRDESYVSLAKWYRSILHREGRFVTLKEKIASSPEVEKLVGAVIWKHNVYSTRTLPEGVHHDYSLYINSPDDPVVEGRPANWTAYEVFDLAKRKGFDRVCIYNTGWNRFGFDSGYPTRLPPNPERGTYEDFRNAAEYGRSLSDGFIYSVHDNYIDCYKNSPEYSIEEMVHNKNGVPVKGGIWRGGRCTVMCSAVSLKYAARDFPEIARMTGRGSIYIDVMGFVPPHACRHPEHPQTRKEDLKSRRRLFALARKEFGSVATEAAPADYCADVVDLGAFFFFTQKIHPGFIDPVPIPLWQLVYHDSVLGYTGEGLCGYSGGDYLAMTALYGLLPTSLDETGRRFSFELRSAYCAEMLSHEFLPVADENGGKAFAARTVFSDGTEVVANCSDEPLTFGKLILDSHSFHIGEKTS